MAKKKYYNKMNGKSKKKGDISFGHDMPTEVIIKDVPSLMYLEQSYDDSRGGIDALHDSAVSGARKQRSDVKY